jgi:peptide-methionine (R)-S-oxide reductase
MQTSDSGYDITPLSEETIERLAQDLNEEEYSILLNHGTEPAFCGTLLDNKIDGTYACRLCGLPLFNSSHKFNSGTGWPSFYRPYSREHLTYIEDDSYGMRRVEIRCARCGGHQGHVFPDGPPPNFSKTAKKFRRNSLSFCLRQFIQRRLDQINTFGKSVGLGVKQRVVSILILCLRRRPCI